MTSSQQSNLYWTGGSFHTRLGTQGNVPEDVLGDAVKFLDEYRGACQKQYIAFNRVCNGRHLAYDRYKSASNPANMDNTIFIGTAFPNSPISNQSPGSSTIATMKIREFLEGLAEGGEFENQHAPVNPVAKTWSVKPPVSAYCSRMRRPALVIGNPSRI